LSEVHSSTHRPPPVPPRIPDHEVLRCIGRGSYGEVWMARAVTGVLRAVKVVRRQDFELERTFEREFEGIKSFEPISRSHPGMIDILHVGRNVNEGFYYYVMELADDRYGGRAINPADYECRTLGTDRRDRDLGQLEMDSITEIGLLLADALAHLHHHGLIHRDVKPSNIVFVDGVAQLADIGLVAAYGQRTYVGTEGFVPPEGPGTPQADTYSLGMVLYELSTGRDRLEFPAVPADMSQLGDKKKWRALNEVICKACAPEPRQRYPHADDMAEDLRRVLEGRTRKKRGLLRRKRFWLAAAALVVLATQARKTPPPDPRPTTTPTPPPVTPQVEKPLLVGPPIPPPPRVGRAHFVTEPLGAEVIIAGQSRGVTPLDLNTLPEGETTVTLRLPHYREVTRSILIDPETAAKLSEPMKFWSPPTPGERWLNSLGLVFLPSGTEHIAALPTTREHFVKASDDEFREGEVLEWKPAGAEETSFIVFVPRKDAEAYRDWIERRDREMGFFGEDHFYRIEEVTEGISPTRDDKTPDHLAFRLVAGLRLFGDVLITSNPEGAEVFEGGKSIGFTPIPLTHRPIGSLEVELKLGGFLPAKLGGEIRANEKLELEATLERSLLAVFDKEWQNSLGMIFHPINGLQFSIWETRVKDYDAFLAATPGRTHSTDLDQAPDHPVVAVDRNDAIAFCKWLTQKERRDGLLEKNWEYRLPSDLEWSTAAGIPTERGDTPFQRNSRIRGVYPWGYLWPPPGGSGNFADQSAAGKVTIEKRGERLLSGNDGFTFTAPVGSFAPSPEGLYDLAGNVWEWVLEDFDEGNGNSNYSTYGVLRGGGWSDYKKENLLSSFRNALQVNLRESHLGFRVVLAASKK
jgi:serine/threonine protein kinase/formylglycine-generating enzyme required for sulfatase activity